MKVRTNGPPSTPETKKKKENAYSDGATVNVNSGLEARLPKGGTLTD